MQAVLCVPPPHSPPNDDIVHKLPPVSIFEESSFVCLLPVYLIVIFLRRSNLRWFTWCRTRRKAKKGSVTRRFIKQQQQQTTKPKKTTPTTNKTFELGGKNWWPSDFLDSMDKWFWICGSGEEPPKSTHRPWRRAQLLQSYYKLLCQKEMGIPDHLTCLLRNLYAGQETS